MFEIGRALARGGADEDQSQAILQLVGKFFQLDRAFLWGGMEIADYASLVT
jgi:hypothetical protein